VVLVLVVLVLVVAVVLVVVGAATVVVVHILRNFLGDAEQYYVTKYGLV
jgi:hypothetical protein